MMENPNIIYQQFPRSNGGKSTAAIAARENRLWRKALDQACGVALITRTAQTRIVKAGTRPEANERRIPAIVYIVVVCEDDPTQNMVTFDGRVRSGWKFNPAKDFSMTQAYAREITALVWEE